jgi:hydrogenase maturation protein HypF
MVRSKSVRINVQGIVQGVGFRPFVYRLAREYDLSGWVRNTSGDVEIELEGSEQALNAFLEVLEKKAPPRSQIEEVKTAFQPVKGYTAFRIRESLRQQGDYQLVSPDIATCDDCKREIFSPVDRRFDYPFTNCTNCGPRFTIIDEIPYDRSRTTMAQFKMCVECKLEYEDPLNRRFHAQPNACPVCGPQLRLVDKKGGAIQCENVIDAVSERLKGGKIVAIRGLGGFHLACDATDGKVVQRLREKKRRPSKPFAVMIATLEEILDHCLVTPEERELLDSPQCPIVLLRWRESSSGIVHMVAPRQKWLGVMLPYTPLHHLLLRAVERPLVMTSGNLSSVPLVKDNEEALQQLGTIADIFLLHNRDIRTRCDDSVCMVEEGTQVLRRARGYAPNPVLLPFKSKQVLACGAELKNTVCLTKNEHAFLSQHIGDMENEETLGFFEETIDLYKRLFHIDPEIVAHDMHPDYVSTKYARDLGSTKDLNLVPVQHHHAHIVSCLIDHGIKGPVIGVAFDGTGYGTDGAIWGGEFLVSDWHHFKRAGHLEYVPLPGGEAAIKKPYRMALSFLYTLLGEDVSVKGLPLSRVDPVELGVIRKQLEQRINAPLTSSAGRLFDAVSAIIGVRAEIDYDAQAAIELEMAAGEGIREPGVYPFSIERGQDRQVVRLGELFSAIIYDVQTGRQPATISLRFHNTMAQIIAEMCTLIAGHTKINQVALSGGVFQNRLLLHLAVAALQGEGFEVLTHKLVPCNDAGISVGQAVIANFS